MLVLAVVLSCAAVLVAAAGLTFVPWLRLRRKSVVVVLDDERTISGVLWRRSGPLLFIRSASIATDKGPVPADGVVVVERSRVLWLQVTG